MGHVLARLKRAGLDAIAELPLDSIDDPGAAVERLKDCGIRRSCVSRSRKAPADARPALLLRASELQDALACIQSINPLPLALSAFRPTTGYEDVKMVALARLAAPNVPSIQVDWQRYGPKLAQVALTFGADDIDGVSASDDAPEGRRRAPLEEIRAQYRSRRAVAGRARRLVQPSVSAVTSNSQLPTPKARELGVESELMPRFASAQWATSTRVR